MTKKLLTLAIPTFNMELYLRDCLNSVTREDVPDSLEVIVVNDGSTDSSLSIMREYEVKRPDIIKIIDKKNGHYGSCINAALKIATGKYFRPLDSDDWFNTDAIIELLSKLETYSVDFIVTQRTEILNHHKKTYTLNNTISNQILNKKQLGKTFEDADGILSMHSLTFSLDLLKRIHLQLTEGVCYTDTEYYIIPLLHSNNFVFFDLDLYQYRLGRDNQSMNEIVFKKNRHQLITVLNNILKKNSLQIDSHEYTRLKWLFFNYIVMVLFECPRKKEDDNDLKETYDLLKKKNPLLLQEIDRKMHHAMSLWKKTGFHLYYYTKIKSFFGIKNIFRQ